MADKTANEVSVSEKNIPTSITDTEKGSFFPWLEGDGDHKKFSIGKIKRFPLLGAVGLLGSALTVLLSWLVLHFFNNHSVINGGRLPKPAAWLSIILSMNSILVHMAVSQGIAVTWWFRASKKTTTVAELHSVWAVGSSVLSAVLSWKAFNYIALATVFVATLPANGILLQNAVTTGVVYDSITSSVNFVIASAFPSGFSAVLDSDNVVSSYHQDFQGLISSIIDAGTITSTSTDNTCKGDCEANVTVVGFKDTCTTYTLPYTLPLDSQASNETADSTILEIDIAWNASTRNSIQVNTLYKSDSACEGLYQVSNCTLNLGKAILPVRVQYNTTGLEDWTWEMLSQQLTPSHSASSFISATDVELFPEPSTPETGDTTYGGVASALQAYFGGSISLHESNGNMSIKLNGAYAQQVRMDEYTYTEADPSNAIPLPNKCNISFPAYAFGNFFDPTSYIMSEIRSTLFLTSVYLGDQMNNNGSTYYAASKGIQTVTKITDYRSKNVYQVMWKYWGASCAITLCIVLFILPTFYGFWTLARKTTLSPFETARAFNAPIMSDAPVHLDTPALLKEVGNTKVRDAAVGVGPGNGVLR